MAAKKRKEDPQTSLFAAPASYSAATTLAVDAAIASDLDEVDLVPSAEMKEVVAPSIRAKPITSIVQLHGPPANEDEPPCPPVRRVERQPDGISIARHIDGQFLITRLRHNGTTYASWFATRSELEELVEKAKEVLK